MTRSKYEKDAAITNEFLNKAKNQYVSLKML